MEPSSWLLRNHNPAPVAQVGQIWFPSPKISLFPAFCTAAFSESPQILLLEQRVGLVLHKHPPQELLSSRILAEVSKSLQKILKIFRRGAAPSCKTFVSDKNWHFPATPPLPQHVLFFHPELLQAHCCCGTAASKNVLQCCLTG